MYVQTYSHRTLCQIQCYVELRNSDKSNVSRENNSFCRFRWQNAKSVDYLLLIFARKRENMVCIVVFIHVPQYFCFINAVI